MQVLVRPSAAADIEQAFVWYEQRRAGLGNEFLTAAQEALEGIIGSPTRNPVIYRGTRRKLLRRFPYAIFYRVYDEVVVVIACLHGRRDPKRWKART